MGGVSLRVRSPPIGGPVPPPAPFHSGPFSGTFPTPDRESRHNAEMPRLVAFQRTLARPNSPLGPPTRPTNASRGAFHLKPARPPRSARAWWLCASCGGETWREGQGIGAGAGGVKGGGYYTRVFIREVFLVAVRPPRLASPSPGRPPDRVFGPGLHACVLRIKI